LSAYAVLEFALTGLAVGGCAVVVLARAVRALRPARQDPAAGGGACGGSAACHACNGCGAGSARAAEPGSLAPGEARPSVEVPLRFTRRPATRV